MRIKENIRNIGIYNKRKQSGLAKCSSVDACLSQG